MNQIYLYLLAPLHTGGTTQEGNLVGIARESHSNLPYVPSSTIRGKLRASVNDQDIKFQLFGNELDDKGDSENLTQGDIWIGDASILFFPVPSLSHGIVWITSPFLLHRWARYKENPPKIPDAYSCHFENNSNNVYLKDAIFKSDDLHEWDNWDKFIPGNDAKKIIKRVMILPDQHCATLIEMSLWRQIKIKLDKHKSAVDGALRSEEAIPPDTLMFYCNGLTAKSNSNSDSDNSQGELQKLINNNNIIQLGGQESLGRGFCQQWN